MSKILRQSIVPIAAVAGAQLINLVTVQSTAHSNEPGCRPGYYQLGDINRLAEAAGRQIAHDAKGYPRVDSVSIQARPVQEPITVGSGASSPPVAPAAAAAASAPVAHDGATATSLWAHQQRLPTQAEESDYQSLRQMKMRAPARPATQAQGENVAL